MMNGTRPIYEDDERDLEAMWAYDQERVIRIRELGDENFKLREALQEIADGEIYPQQVARAALWG